MPAVVGFAADVVRGLVLHLAQGAAVALREVAVGLQLSLGAGDLALLAAKLEALAPSDRAVLAALLDAGGLALLAVVDAGGRGNGRGGNHEDQSKGGGAVHGVLLVSFAAGDGRLVMGARDTGGALNRA